MDWEAIKRAQDAQRMLNQHGVREALDHHERLQRSGVDISRLGEQADLSRDVMSQGPHTASVKRLLEDIETLRRPLPPEWVDAKRSFDEFALRFGRSVLEVRTAIEVATGPLRDFVERWQHANRLLNNTIRSAPSDSLLGAMVRQAMRVYEANAIRIESQIADRNLFSINPSLAADMFIPTVRYLGFSQRTVGLISDSADAAHRVALGASLVIAEEHVSDATQLIVDAGGGDPEDDGQTITAASTSYPIYDVVQLDLIDVRELPPEATYPVLIRFSSAASLAALTRLTLNAVLRCNKASKLKGRSEIFKLTIQAQEALVLLPGTVVRDENSLRDVVTYLYMLVYEGAGDQKLRFLKEQGGPMERVECDALWNLKALRNKWLIHDPEHGDAMNVDKSYRSLDEALRNLGLRNYPSGRNEFEHLQRSVLTSLLQFHLQLEKRIVEL